MFPCASARGEGNKKKGWHPFFLKIEFVCLHLLDARADRQTTRPNRDKPRGSRDTSTVLLSSEANKRETFNSPKDRSGADWWTTSWTVGRISGPVIWVFICSDEAGSSCFELFGFGTGSTVSKETECTSRRRRGAAAGRKGLGGCFRAGCCRAGGSSSSP